jgi:hypothetical protein
MNWISYFIYLYALLFVAFLIVAENAPVMADEYEE